MELIQRGAPARRTGRLFAWRSAVSVLVSARSLTVVALTLAVLLRVVLALVNREANDDHIEVITPILTEGRLPRFGECVECFHPKLYHVAVAAVGALLPDPSPTALIIAGQLLNVAAGLATLWVVFRFLRRFVPDPTTRALAFALTVLNPDLASINGMATNDSFVILWSTVAVYGVVCFLEAPRLGPLVLGAGGAVLAGLSKGNALVTAAVLMGALVVGAILRRRAGAPGARRVAAGAAAFCLVWLAITPWAGQYVDNARRSGSPFAINRRPEPWPHFFEQTYIGRAGVTSIFHSYLTFHIVDLIFHPTNDTRVKPRHAHRTSLWSQLYGRAHFSHFPAQPQTWKQVHHKFVNAVGRGIMVLALVPTALLVLGGALRLDPLWRALPDPRPFLSQRHWLLDVLTLGYLAFVVVYSARYRDFSMMKFIFILPALLGLLTWFVRGYTAARDYFGASRGAVAWLNGSMVVLLALYVADVLTLILHIAGLM